MIDPERTTTLLLEGLNDAANDEAWGILEARYRPIVVAVARRLGLGEADAQDAAQETLIRFLEEYRAGKYDRDRARLGAWIVAIARTRIALAWRKRARRREVRGESAVGDVVDHAALVEAWEAERRAEILRRALDELRSGTKTDERTIRAFELLVVRRMPAPAVAEAIGITRQEVYVAKSRVAERLRAIVDRLERVYDGES